MCGIIGFTNVENQVSATKDLEVMMEKIKHRGPDEHGIYIDEEVALGAVRLSINDLSNGSQPFSNEDGTVTVIYNGEIYNFHELTKNLIEKGYQLHSQCDGAVIPYLYEEYGVEFLKLIDGMYSIALWDSKKEKLVLAVDPMGIKPLYYHVTENNQLLFGSELKGFLHKIKDIKICYKSIFQYLRYKFIPAPYTPFESVHKLKGGEVLTYSSGELSFKYIKVEEILTTNKNTLEEDLIESVYSTTMSDVDTACIASGGLDSSFVLKIMSEQRITPLQVYTVGYKGMHKDDETKFASLISAQQEALFNGIKLDYSEIPNILSKVIYYLDEPNQDPISVPFFYLMKYIGRNFKVVLTGDGADEIFGGYDRFKNWDDNGNSEGYFSELCLFNDDELSSLFNRKPNFNRDADIELSNVKSLRDAINWERKYRLQSYHLNRVDKLSMAWGVEARVPFLRPKIVQHTRTYNENQYRDNGTEKAELRKAVGAHLPDWLNQRKKKPFRFPISEWLKGELRDWVHENLLGSNCELHYFLNKKEIEKLVYNHEANLEDNSYKIWSLIVLNLYIVNFNNEYKNRKIEYAR
ncbi:asparagine synthase (glutamine-hydrolyzing) [Rossellomorea vietnamensis]|uniref:asparagine synthase (glutamine-hydrolyzing) n=1 Tax=Rossellomorea vietnamensis TaxID=218284 RepID=A0A0N8GG62_9BACI|nr:asparagine synthase (glutamine-hydrolyzing) [Rossellomorea vietnamensis]KPL57610.1 hypothetical protein AM506_21305 [Rossellomorea vietnamensis]